MVVLSANFVVFLLPLKRKRITNGPQLFGKGKRNPYNKGNKNNNFPPDNQPRPLETNHIPTDLSPWSSVKASQNCRSSLSSSPFGLSILHGFGPQPVKNESEFDPSPLNSQAFGFPPNSQDMNRMQYFTPAPMHPRNHGRRPVTNNGR